MPTMPDAPPAIAPSAAVGRSSPVSLLRATPAARLRPSVPALTMVTGSHADATSFSDDDWT